MNGLNKEKIPNRILIANFPQINWKKRLAIFFSIFSFSWLLLEPLSSFGLSVSIMSHLGLWGYLGLFVISLLLVMIYELLQKRKIIGEMNLIPITVTLTETGTIHYLKTPIDIKTGVFIKKFIETLSYIPKDSVLSHPNLYNYSILIIKDQEVIEIDSKKTFSELEIDFDEELKCRILGRIKDELLEGKAIAELRRARPVEIVICIDITGSMGNTINDFKSNLIELHQNITNEFRQREIPIYDIAIKIIAFRDYYVDKDTSIKITPFFNLPNEKLAYEEFIKSLVAHGGGDTPETSLEALALGIMSEWDTSGQKNQLVVLITDAPPHPLEKNLGSKPTNYPENIPQTMNDLKNLWEREEYLKNSGKKLLLVTPKCEEWELVQNSWSMVWYLDFAKLTQNNENVSAYITQLIADSMIDKIRMG